MKRLPWIVTGAMVILVVISLTMTVWLYQRVNNLSSVTIPKGTPTPMLVYLCNDPDPDYQVSVEGKTVNLSLETPIRMQWAFDFGDDSHSPIWYTIASQTYTITHEYQKGGEYLTTLLTYDPAKNCDSRKFKPIYIP